MGTDHDDEIIHRDLETTRDAPGTEIAEIVADLEETEPETLSSVWRCIDDMLVALFSDPPAAEAQVVVTFSYESYRITVEQNGSAQFVKPEE